MPGSILGSTVRRREDPRLITGGGLYVDDVPAPGCLHVAFVRSPYAHARFPTLDLSAALAMPGVVAVETAESLGLSPRLAFAVVDAAFARPPLAAGVVRFAGEPVAVVVAATRELAVDASQAVQPEYEPLPSVVDPAAAADDEVLLFAEHGTNLAFEMVYGDQSDALEGAEVVVRERLVNQRLAAVPMEANAILAVPAGSGLILHVSTQSPFQVRDAVAEAVGLPEESVRCITGDVGGGFGAKIAVYPEYVVVATLANRLARPVKWIETRSENLVAMNQGRGQVQEVELGARRDGSLVGMKVRITADAGAYPEQGAFLPFLTGQMASGVYRLPRIDFAARSYATNTTPTAAYRGAGRPEATALVERMLDRLAVELEMDPAALRRRNLIAATEFPYSTAAGATYDSGDYEAALDRALQLSDYASWRNEQARRRVAGERRVVGIGISTYVEVTAVGSPTEFAAIAISAEGGATVAVGTSSQGQGHATAYSMLVADRLGIPLDLIEVVEGDTGRVARGDGTSGSRSLQLGGSAVVEAAALVLERARMTASAILEADPEDLEVVEGGIGVKGVPGRVAGWPALAAVDPDLSAETDFFAGDQTYPFGCHVSVVEVDLDTGGVRLLQHVAVDDCGTVLNPMLAAGQVHGGVAQGIGQALFEEVIHDADGTPRTATLLDYSVPSAAEMPPLLAFHTQTPTPNNPLGAKGIGESGTIGSTPAVQNAVVDALAHLGVRHLDMPLSPERIWRAASQQP